MRHNIKLAREITEKPHNHLQLPSLSSYDLYLCNNLEVLQLPFLFPPFPYPILFI